MEITFQIKNNVYVLSFGHSIVGHFGQLNFVTYTREEYIGSRLVYATMLWKLL